MKLLQRATIAFIRLKFKLLTLLSPKTAARQAFNLFCTPQSRHRQPLTPFFLEATQLETSFSGYSIKGYGWNTGGKSKLLIVHGFESSVTNFEQLIGELISKGHAVYGFDAPAHGRSAGTRINLIQYRDFLLQLDSEFGPFDIFLAHSFGGLAMGLAVSNLPAARLPKIVFIAPLTETSTTVDQFFRIIAPGNHRLRSEFEQLGQTIGKQPLAWFTLARIVPHLHGKMLWVHDEDDLITPLSDAIKVKEKNYSNLQFVITKGLGHRRIYRDKEVGKTIVDFT